MTGNHVQWLATLVTMHSDMAEAWLARDNTEGLQTTPWAAALPLSITGRARTQEHHVHLRTRAKLSCKGTGEPATTTGSLRQTGIWLQALLYSMGTVITTLLV